MRQLRALACMILALAGSAADAADGNTRKFNRRRLHQTSDSGGTYDPVKVECKASEQLCYQKTQCNGAPKRACRWPSCPHQPTVAAVGAGSSSLRSGALYQSSISGWQLGLARRFCIPSALLPLLASAGLIQFSCDDQGNSKCICESAGLASCFPGAAHGAQGGAAAARSTQQGWSSGVTAADEGG